MVKVTHDSRGTFATAYWVFAGEHAGREIPSFSSKTADIQHASMCCPIVTRQLCSVHIAILYWDLKVESMMTCRSLFSGSSLDMNTVNSGWNVRKRRSRAGPPFLQFGVPRPQTAFFSWECTFSDCLLSIAAACATVTLNTCSPQSMHTTSCSRVTAEAHIEQNMAFGQPMGWPNAMFCSMLSLIIIDWQQQLALCYHSQYARLSHNMAKFQSRYH